MSKVGIDASARRWKFAVGSSAMALMMASASAATAQCSPDPTIADGTTACSGNDTDGIRVTTANTTLTVAPGANVTTTGTSAITVDVLRGDYSSFTANTINVGGSVSADGQSAIAVMSGTSTTPSYYSTQQIALTVGAGGAVSGATALALLPSPGNASGTISATVDNAGTLTGTGGIALLGNATTNTYGYDQSIATFTTITNQAAGAIVGGILGPVVTLGNAGSIDGGASSAVDSGNSNSSYYATITNSAGGAIRSTSNAATLRNTTASTTITNDGTIANAGSGAALSAGLLTIANNADGEITSAGSTAVQASFINLVNKGVVTGNVVATGGGNTIDSTTGRIDGAVTFGNDNNTVAATYVGRRALATGITGTITTAGTNNVERVVFSADTDVTTPIDLDAGFQKLVLAPDAQVTATLLAGFSTANSLTLSGRGAVINRTTLTAPGISDLDYGFASSAVFTNEGTIEGSGVVDTYGRGGYAVTFSNHNFINRGIVTNDSRGVSMFNNTLENSGQITTKNTGVEMSDAVLNNSGTITSTAGVGVSLFGNVGLRSSNSGTITGATTGVMSYGYYLTNTGTISSAGTGVSIDQSFTNAAGGVVSGGSGPAVMGGYNASIANAGTINGNVVVGDGAAAYLALSGGTLNGNLAMGDGSTLLTDLVNTGTGSFAGINGTVTVTGKASLLYAINTDTSANLISGDTTPFSSVGYQVAHGAKLTLSGPDGQARTQTLVLAGNGSVDLNGAVSVIDAPAIRSTKAITYPDGSPETAALAITNRGNITVLQSADSTAYSLSGVSLNSDDTFANLGTITVTNRAAAGSLTAITGGASITNAGSILLDGSTGISNFQPETLVNSGDITQVDGGAMANGITGPITVNNSGTIRVGGVAVEASGSTISNSGTIASTGGVAIGAIRNSYGSATAVIVNAAGGMITGTGGTAVQLYSGLFSNAGTVSGTVDLGYDVSYYSGAPTRSYSNSTYVAAGGTIAGDLLFGDGDDLLLQTADALGVSGTIDGGAGRDIYGRSLTSSDTVALDLSKVRNFEDGLVQVLGADTVATVTANGTFGGNLFVAGNGQVVNQASITGSLSTALPSSIPYSFASAALFPDDQVLAAITNTGSIAGGVSVTTSAFTNSGTITQAEASLPSYSYPGYPYYPYGDSTPSVLLSGTSVMTIRNSGQISGGGLTATNYSYVDVAPTAIDFANSGTISSDNKAAAAAINVYDFGSDNGGTIQIANSGTLSAQVDAASGTNATALSLNADPDPQPIAYTITNSGTIRATATGASPDLYPQTNALLVSGAGLSGTITNTASGVITASGERAYAILIAETALNLSNAGVITATGTKTSTAIQTFDAFDNVIVNTGTITGDIFLGDGADTLDNAGTINGAVSLGAGDDRFIQRVGATVSGLVDGGDGNDRYIVDASGGTATLAASQISNFETVTQTGTGTGTGYYSGTFNVDTIALAGGTLAVAAGQTLATSGVTTITGGDAGVSIVNAGRIAGAVRLGAGDDSYTDMAGSIAAGGVDGGGGTNLYRVILNGNRSGIGARANFQQLAVAGTGTLTLALDQNFQSVSLAGANLNASLGGFTIGRIDGSAAAESASVDGDVAAASLGGGDDTLALGATTLAGRYDGGDGTDVLRLTANGPVTLTGTATHFETVSLANGTLTIAGTLGSDGAALAFGDGAQAVTVASGGTLAGSIDLGAGDDSFTLARGGALIGTVAGGAGAGTDTATLDFANGLTLNSGTLTGFEQLVAQGSGTLALNGGGFSFDTATIAGDLTIAADASLTTSHLTFGPADNRLTIAGTFAGSVAGGIGTDSIDVSGGSVAAPVAFETVSGIEALRMSAGFATVSGDAAFGTVALAGGRLVGLAGSTIAASNITVGSNATFGSAGTVNGNVTVNGTLSPGASPGTMTVNGTVSLAGGSTSLFEITPSVSDKLVVNGALSIAQGATLQLVATGAVKPGTVTDLIVASGGITGSYTTVVKPASLFGFLVQDDTRIRLAGEFLNDASFSAPVRRSIDYVNTVLVSGKSSAALLAVAPSLVTASGASNAALFGQLTPEAYASAQQITVGNGLSLAASGRGADFAARRDTPGLFTFASVLGGTATLEADAVSGNALARTNGYGFLGGIGFGGATWSIGAFGGYMNNRQTLVGLAAHTRADGAVAGVHGRFASGGFGIKATVAYDGGDASTRRSVPDGSVYAEYRLHGWTADALIDYALPVTGTWTVRPSLGATAIRATRSAANEVGTSAFALSVARRNHTAVFVDGGLTFSGSALVPGARITPYLSLGARYQAKGRTPAALAGFGGGDLTLLAEGASRAPVLATATLGAEIALSPRLTLFGALTGESGEADHRAGGRTGLRLAF
ncbi:autotransporter outer membrane beta-barrel domain-containing protein [Sphingomonas sp. BAUL-RG-20F-R05-02]|uniref:autotransporter outer membrane beta-barrel domain-containing protein n=1 Tax=Sphingomonas sp. BAUL-RG-20F-R05-02 TaxID=2914830 RepID=UPI001F57F5BB|nr:autotransporter outer membrane beta-barrel domain-containing protein [Sphingomonas sp. BAUL-RG-20F-R05-02]